MKIAIDVATAIVVVIITVLSLWMAHYARVRTDQPDGYNHKNIYPGAPRNIRWALKIFLYYLLSPIWVPLLACAG